MEFYKEYKRWFVNTTAERFGGRAEEDGWEIHSTVKWLLVLVDFEGWLEYASTVWMLHGC